MTITTSKICYEIDGLTMVGHLARPAGGKPHAAVLLAHDGVGLEDYQRGRADDLATHGYIALAMDYHGGQLFFDRPQEMLARTLPLLADVERMLRIGRKALDLLLAQPDVDPHRVAGLGYGAGGRIVLELARTGAAFHAVAVIHPAFPQADAQDWREVTSSFLLCTGSEDPICTPEQALAFGKTLQQCGIDWRVNILGGARHAFWARPTNADGSPVDGTAHTQATVPGVGYHPTQTPRAWRAVLDLFEEAFAAPSSVSLEREPTSGA
ncbi:dienelactone hydrolase family protein [Sphingomonas sp. ASV193]|uniref:dienelactone hydrolase family protein n=1 Tax=Sphingomonas sp. ASV193 TaxID=3144405 RepID=UPI0032E8A650